jgi:omega-amidase
VKLTIGLAQMDVILGQPEKNLATVARLAAEAAEKGVEWLVLPELWSTGYDLERAEMYATPVEAGIFAEVGRLAQQHGLYILGSCLARLPGGGGGVGNTAVFHAPSGEILGQYSKIHLFQLMDEHHYLTAGEAPALVEWPWGQVGLTICYDLRFPELFRAYALAGANLIVVPAEWPQPRLAHWRTLLRARAIENQLYVVACNRVGTSKATTFFGHSTIVDPWGGTVIEGGETAELLTATIDLDLVEQVRNKIPVFADRRPINFVSGTKMPTE